MSGSTPVVSQSIMKAIVPVGASTEIWLFLETVLLAQGDDVVPRLLGGLKELQRYVRRVDPLHGVAMLAHDSQHRFPVLGVTRERVLLLRDTSRLGIEPHRSSAL